jgi:lipoprotein-releasing system ATP-binding protein
MSDPLIQVQGLAKSFHDGERELHILHGLNFRLDVGEVVAIMGPSGSGKSTLLNLLAALDRPTKGSIHVDGNDLTKANSSVLNRIRLEKIGLVFQFHHLLQEYRAWENVAMPAFIAGGSRAASRERAIELLGRVGLADRVEHVPTKLSGGEQQRVALARALMNDPPIVLADEPTGNLDEKTGRRVADLLWDVTREGKRSLLIVTHENGIAERADRVLRLHEGRLEAG